MTLQGLEIRNKTLGQGKYPKLRFFSELGNWPRWVRKNEKKTPLRILPLIQTLKNSFGRGVVVFRVHDYQNTEIQRKNI